MGNIYSLEVDERIPSSIGSFCEVFSRYPGVDNLVVLRLGILFYLLLQTGGRKVVEEAFC